MKKRLKFECWKCSRDYTLLREISEEQTLLVACPYCNAEAVADLAPYRKKVKTVMRGDKEPATSEELELPEVLPTQEKPE